MHFFKVGEKAKLVYAGSRWNVEPKLVQYIDTEVTVVEALQPMQILKGGHGYVIKAHDGTEMRCIPECLEKPQPPKEDMGSWEDTPYADVIRAPKRVPVEPVTCG